jgi:acyl-coenzyme A thioesterase 9
MCAYKCHLVATLTLPFSVAFYSGYLMRLAYELGFANTTLFCRGPVRFLSLDKISFAKPVSIGSILRLRSMIIHSTASEKYPAIVVSSSYLLSRNLSIKF